MKQSTTSEFEVDEIFSAPGTYEVWLTIENDDASDDFKKVVFIHPKSLNETQPD